LAEFKNPTQQGGQDNKSFLVMALVMLMVFFGLKAYQSRHTAPVPPANQTAAATTPSPSSSSASAAAPNASQTAPADATPAVLAAAEATTTVENELYRIQFTNRGAQVLSWQLKKYKDEDGKPLDLIHEQAAKKAGYPLSLYTQDAALTTTLNQALYVPSTTGNLASPSTLTFQYAGKGLVVTKTFSFDETYVLHADISVTNNGAPVRAFLSWPSSFGDLQDARSYAGTQIDSSTNGKVDHLAIKKIHTGTILSGPFDWAGVSDSYFAAVFLPDQPDTAGLATFHDEIDVAKAKHNNNHASPSEKPVLMPVLGAALGDTSGHTLTRIFVGPKAIAVLKAIHATDHNVTLEPILDFGFFGPIGKYLFVALQFVQSHISSNWGWSIVILTIFINALLLPLRIKTMKSSIKMQRIQPQMDAIKARYKGLKATDPKRNEMNAEVMELQKANGVNMFGGCIPSLVQLPLLYAFLYMLPKIIELRQAHWLWLPDLTIADPYRILPIVMVVSQFLVQFYTPSPGVDPQQQKMMAFVMPLFSGYICWTYSSGLALYWVVGNLFSIATQSVMNQTSLGREMREIAAKRARRKSQLPGKAQTIQGRR
jgi:YidC/Oxa1 family membrane protein insertase